MYCRGRNTHAAKIWGAHGRHLCRHCSPWTRWWTHDTGMDRRAAVWAWRTPVVGALGDVGGDRPKSMTPLATFVALISLAIWDGDHGLCHTSSLLRRPARRPGAWPVTAGGARKAPRSCWQGYWVCRNVTLERHHPTIAHPRSTWRGEAMVVYTRRPQPQRGVRGV